MGIEIGDIEKTAGKAWIAETREVSAMIVGLRNSLTDN
jgi:hypothetical protein